MAVDVLLGLQWGDEGKGKIVDFLAPQYQVVARFQGGPNAGHTLEFDGIKHVLHQIPSGIFHNNIQNIIGNGVVLDPVIFKVEIEKLDKFSIDFGRNLYLSKKAQLILPSHRLLDAAYEHSKGDKKIGSTLKGIGPTYQDKVARLGLRVGDVLLSNFKDKYDKLTSYHKTILDFYKFDYSDLEEKEKDFFKAIEFLKEFNMVDSEYFINSAIKEEKTILAEGAQGSLLDIDFGSYPYVTSSNTMVAGACTGLGISPSKVGRVIGIFKAYCTRVGSGPFPTELNDQDGETLRKEGNEFGSTTGRARRCGWLDLVALKYAVMLNGATELWMMKVDVLNSFEEIKICHQYKLSDGTFTEELPYDLDQVEFEPVYKSFKGWNQDLGDCKSFSDLPQELMGYIRYIEDKMEIPVKVISVGPDRTQTILKETIPA